MAGSSHEEVRIDQDGATHTEAGFVKYYGATKGLRRWMAAKVNRPSPPPGFTPAFNRGVEEAIQEVYEFAQHRHALVSWRYCHLMQMYYCLHLLPNGQLLLRDQPPVGEAWEEIF